MTENNQYLQKQNTDLIHDPLFGLERKIILEFYDTHFLAVDVTTNEVLTFILPLSFDSFIQYNNLLNKYNQIKVNNLNLFLQDYQRKNYILNSFVNDIANNNIKKHNELISISRSIINNEFIPVKYLDNITVNDFELIVENKLSIQLNYIHQLIHNPTYRFILEQQYLNKLNEQVSKNINSNYYTQNNKSLNELEKEDNNNIIESNKSNEEVLKENEVNEEVFKQNEVNEEVLKENDVVEEVLKENEVNEEVLKENENVEEVLTENEVNEEVLKENEEVLTENEVNEEVNEENKNNYWLNRKNKILQNENTTKNKVINETKKELLQDIIFDENHNKYYEKIFDLLTCIKFDVFNFKNDKRFDNRLVELKKVLNKNIKRFNNKFNFVNFRINIYTEKPISYVHQIDYQDNYLSNDILNRVKNTIEKKEGSQIELIKNINLYRINNDKSKYEPYILHFSNQFQKILKNILKETSNWFKNKNDKFIVDFNENSDKSKIKYSFYQKDNNLYPCFLDIIFNSNNVLTGDLILIWY